MLVLRGKAYVYGAKNYAVDGDSRMHRTKIGEIEAQAGMELANGCKVVKVNDKSVIAEHDVLLFYLDCQVWILPHPLEKRRHRLVVLLKKILVAFGQSTR